MKFFFAALAYMVIGGIFAALIINAQAEKCGPQTVKSVDFVAMAAAWPAIIAAAFSVNEGALEKNSCSNPGEEARQ